MPVLLVGGTQIVTEDDFGRFPQARTRVPVDKQELLWTINHILDKSVHR